MITEIDFAAIDKEVQDSINAIYEHIRQNYPSDYVLLLADGEYKEKYLHTIQKFEPNVIDNREDLYMDETRVKFFVQFLQTFYTFPSTGNKQVDDSEIRQQMELMVYTHVWESKPFLKRMYRMALLCTGQSYQWHVEVPPMTKHKFIREEIKQRFEDTGFHLFQVIKNGYHSSLRNAFAHSEYSFDEQNKSIFLYNYGGGDWELEYISYDDWSKRFCYSVLLGYHLMNITYERRKRLDQDMGTTLFEIDYPVRNGNIVKTNIRYRPEHNAFNFEK